METLIAMQDIRTNLAGIAKRAMSGEAFIVLRDSRPAFRIEPYVSDKPRTGLLQVMESFADYPAKDITPADVEAEIRAARSERRKKAFKYPTTPRKTVAK